MQILQKESRSKPQLLKIGYQFVEVASDLEEVEITETTKDGSVSYIRYRYTVTRYTHQEWAVKLMEDTNNLKQSQLRSDNMLLSLQEQIIDNAEG